jgi:hypothetical protein
MGFIGFSSVEEDQRCGDAGAFNRAVVHHEKLTLT